MHAEKSFYTDALILKHVACPAVSHIHRQSQVELKSCQRSEPAETKQTSTSLLDLQQDNIYEHEQSDRLKLHNQVMSGEHAADADV